MVRRTQAEQKLIGELCVLQAAPAGGGDVRCCAHVRSGFLSLEEVGHVWHLCFRITEVARLHPG